MSFSKATYRNRRKQGKRGQGDKPTATFEPGEGHHMVRGPKGLQMVNRKQARQKLRAKFYEDDEDKVGKPFTRKGVKHQQGKPKFTGPTYAPEVSNHERVFRQRIKSGRIKLNEGEQ